MSDLARGIKPVTGLLFAKADHGAVGALADESIVLRLQPGPGFAIGFHGWSVYESASSGTDGSGYRWELGTNTEITAVQDGQGNDVMYSTNQRVEGPAVPDALLWNPDRFYNDQPMLVIRDVISRINALSGVIEFAATLFYVIYEISDSDFLRIAGMQLASRSSV